MCGLGLWPLETLLGVLYTLGLRGRTSSMEVARTTRKTGPDHDDDRNSQALQALKILQEEVKCRTASNHNCLFDPSAHKPTKPKKAQSLIACLTMCLPFPRPIRSRASKSGSASSVPVAGHGQMGSCDTGGEGVVPGPGSVPDAAWGGHPNRQVSQSFAVVGLAEASPTESQRGWRL